MPCFRDGARGLRRISSSGTPVIQPALAVDLVAGYGGEEFVAVLDCGREGALLMAERMRHRIEALQIAHVRSEASSVVPASLGVASRENTCAQSAEALLAAADKALYKLKTSGRNAVLAAEAQL